MCVQTNRLHLHREQWAILFASVVSVKNQLETQIERQTLPVPLVCTNGDVLGLAAHSLCAHHGNHTKEPPVSFCVRNCRRASLIRMRRVCAHVKHICQRVCSQVKSALLTQMRFKPARLRFCTWALCKCVPLSTEKQGARGPANLARVTRG